MASGIRGCLRLGMWELLSTHHARPNTKFRIVSWISLTLAFSFGVYGLIRKTVPVNPLIDFCVESLVLLPPAAAYLVVQGFSGGGSIFGDSAWVALLLVLTGVTTAA